MAQENLPLTAVESVQQRLEDMPASPDLKAALAPGKDINLQNAPVAALLSGKSYFVIQFKQEDLGKLSGTLNEQLAQKMFAKNYVGLSNDQKYLIVSLEAILEHGNVDPSKMELNDTLYFDFKGGRCVVDRKGNNHDEVTLQMKVPAHVEVTGVARDKLAAELTLLEKEGLLVKALQQFKEDPTMQGRLRYLSETPGFVDLVNHYMKDKSKALSHRASNLGYTGSVEQNIAYLKAYLAVKRKEELGVPLPTDAPEAPLVPTVEPTPDEEVDTGVPDDFFEEKDKPTRDDFKDKEEISIPAGTSTTMTGLPTVETAPAEVDLEAYKASIQALNFEQTTAILKGEKNPDKREILQRHLSELSKAPQK